MTHDTQTATERIDRTWTMWTGGEIPVHPNTVVEVLCEGDAGSRQEKAGLLRWTRLGLPGDIIHYRVHLHHIEPNTIPPESSNVDKTLTERGNRYGEFKEHARITQNIKRAMVDSPNWDDLPDPMKEALEMLAHKVGRILNGDPHYADSWHDIIGYTRLVEKDLSQ